MSLQGPVRLQQIRWLQFSFEAPPGIAVECSFIMLIAWTLKIKLHLLQVTLQGASARYQLFWSSEEVTAKVGKTQWEARAKKR